MRKQESMGRRIIAGLIDIGITAFVAGILMYVLAEIMGKGILYYAILFPILLFFYMTVMDLATGGQTIGRMIMKERVVGKNNKMPSAVDFIARNIVKTMPILIIVLFPSIWFITFVLAGIYLLVPFVHSKGYAVHDIVGATVVNSYRPGEVMEAIPVSEEVPCGEIGKVAMELILEAVKAEAEEKQQAEEVKQQAEEVKQQAEAAVERHNQEDVVHPDKEQVQYGILCVSGMYEGAFLPLTREVAMGRSHTCNLVFEEDAPRISRRHCSVAYNAADNTYILTDLQSSYGTFLGDGSKVPTGKAVLLKEGEEFSLGLNERFKVGRKS